MNITADFKIKTIIDKNTYEINYGNLKKGANTEVNIVISDVDHLSIAKTCGCTNPTVQLRVDGGITLIVKYDSNKLGVINQSIFEKVIDRETKTEKTITFKLLGTII